MKLLYDLKEPALQALSLREGESVWYCVPVDLGFHNDKKSAGDSYTTTTYLVVTEERFVVLQEDAVTAEYALESCEKIKCEHQVGSGIVTVFGKEGSKICVARFSMRHIIRVAYVTRGAQAIIDAKAAGKELVEKDRVESHEYEKYCEKCGRAMPGTRHCPYCDGKATLRQMAAACSRISANRSSSASRISLHAGSVLTKPLYSPSVRSAEAMHTTLFLAKCCSAVL